MKIGLSLPQEWDSKRVFAIEAYETMTRVAQEAERLGFASVWLFDHFHSTTSPLLSERMIFECWTSLAALARDTTRIRLGQLVTCSSFRAPALLAKMASTIDVLSHGRLEVGIGAGWYEQEYMAYGYPFPDTPTRLRQLREYLQIIKAMWTEQEASFSGKYYRIDGAINQPKGVQKPHIPLLIGGKGEQVTLKLVARYGDACNFTHPTPEEIARKFALLKRYCEEIGRNEREIRRTILVNGFLAETDEQAKVKATLLQNKFSLEQLHLRSLVGSPATVRNRLAELEQQGIQEVIVVLPDIVGLESLWFLGQCINEHS